MASFCIKCGSPLDPGPFCGKCGTDARLAAAGAPSQAVAQPAPSAHVTSASATTMSPLMKLGIAAILIIFVGGALALGGIYYVAHRVNAKLHEVAGGLDGTGSTAAHSDSRGAKNFCNLLSKEDVSHAIGVAIIRAENTDNGCNYIAQGDQADMTAKHATAMAAGHGADKQSQQMLQAFAGGMFKNLQEQRNSPADQSGEVPVLLFSIDQNSAGAQMQLNSKALGILGPSGAQGITGLGDEAFVSGESLLMFRKGNNLVRVMYMTCPCGTEAVKPLAKKIADRL